MTKKIAKIFIGSSVFFACTSIASAQVLMPSLTDTLQKNEVRMQELHNEQKNKNTTVKPQFTPALEDNYTYSTIYSGSSITIKKANEANLYLQEIDLKKGAIITSSLEVLSYNSITGEPQFVKKNINEALSGFLKKPISLINGQFFNPRTQPSELSFGLKSDNLIRTAGADNRNENKNILHIADGYAEILPYSWKNLESTTGSFAMVNLAVSVPRYKDEKIGRTYMCLAYPDAKNQSSKLLVFVADAMTEGMIENEIYKHGCKPNSTSKLDSSGSTRFWHNGSVMYGLAHKGEADRRKIPHSIVFFDK